MTWLSMREYGSDVAGGKEARRRDEVPWAIGRAWIRVRRGRREEVGWRDRSGMADMSGLGEHGALAMADGG